LLRLHTDLLWTIRRVSFIFGVEEELKQSCARSTPTCLSLLAHHVNTETIMSKRVAFVASAVFAIFGPGLSLAQTREVRFANFLPATLPQIPMKPLVLDWRLIHRDEQKMDELFRSSKFGRNCTRVLFEQEQINLFAECVRD
jgi:hypothetical protein